MAELVVGHEGLVGCKGGPALEPPFTAPARDEEHRKTDASTGDDTNRDGNAYGHLCCCVRRGVLLL